MGAMIPKVMLDANGSVVDVEYEYVRIRKIKQNDLTTDPFNPKQFFIKIDGEKFVVESKSAVTIKRV